MAWRFSASTSRAPELYGAAASSSAPAAAAQLSAVQRDFYLEHPDVAALTPEQVQTLRTLSGTIYGDELRCPNPVGSFVQASFPQYILDALRKVGFASPTAIQRQGWPVAMKEERQSGWSRKTCGRSEPMSAETVVA